LNPRRLHVGAKSDVLKRSNGTMSFTRPILFWIAALAAFISVVVLLHAVLLPFVAGMVLAYLLNPLASRIEQLGVSRGLATFVIMISVVGTIAILLTLIVPTIARELAGFFDSLPLYVRRLHALGSDSSRPWLSKIVGQGFGVVERSINEATALASTWFDSFLHSIWSGGRALMSVLSLAVVAPIVACYLLSDWNGMMATIDNWIPPAQRETVRALAREVDQTISGFVLGQSKVCLILAVFYAAALYLLGIEHGLLIGFVSGIMGFIPYLGSLSGLVVSTCVAIAQFWPNWSFILLVPLVFLVGQLLGDYVLAPNLVARRVHLNPVWAIFALFAFGYLFGFVGLLIAMPAAAAIGVVMRFAFRQYYASPLYAAASSAGPTEIPTDPRRQGNYGLPEPSGGFALCPDSAPSEDVGASDGGSDKAPSVEQGYLSLPL
jgi:predicted PurR-regulated permease PerM